MRCRECHRDLALIGHANGCLTGHRRFHSFALPEKGQDARLDAARKTGGAKGGGAPSRRLDPYKARHSDTLPEHQHVATGGLTGLGRFEYGYGRLAAADAARSAELDADPRCREPADWERE